VEPRELDRQKINLKEVANQLSVLEVGGYEYQSAGFAFSQILQ
jgi:hypothetical protein